MKPIPWPQLEVQAPDPGQALAGFSGELRSSREMSALRDRLAQVVNDLQDTLAQRLENAVQQVCKQLDALASQLQGGLTESLTADLERLRADMANKEAQIEHLQALVQEVGASLTASKDSP